jgi:multidrug efflux system membrane fusion protein
LSGDSIAPNNYPRGDLVAAGQEIGRIDPETLEAQVRQAGTQQEQAARDLENALALQARGVATEDRVSQARAAKAAADAAVTAAEEQLENTIIRAPFAGRLNDLTLDEGEFVDGGDPVAELLDNDPLTVTIQVPQQALSRINEGQTAQVQFITGETREGAVSFIGANADMQTRTFRVELTVDNPDSEMPAGLSARVAIPTGQARGHFISPAILSLGTDGTLGIKTVEADNTVAFAPVEIVRAQTDGVWVTGLPDDADIITVGQGFVSAGDPVDPRPADPIDTAEVSQ